MYCTVYVLHTKLTVEQRAVGGDGPRRSSTAQTTSTYAPACYVERVVHCSEKVALWAKGAGADDERRMRRLRRSSFAALTESEQWGKRKESLLSLSLC